MKPEPLFYIPVEGNDHEVAGPYDLVQMARLLRTNIITPETLTFREGEQEWKSFGDRPQFIVAKEMPADAVSLHVDRLQEAQDAKRSPIPLPSGAWMAKMAGMAVLTLIGGVVAYFVSAADTSTGFIIAVISGAVALLGQVWILVHILDEGWITRILVIFVPLFDIYYFIANLEKYLPFFCMKYIGVVLLAASVAGVASVDPEQAEQIKEILRMFRLW